MSIKFYDIFIEAECVAHSDVHFIRINSYDSLATLDIYAILCDQDFPYEGGYNVVGFESEDQSNGAWQYYTNDEWHLHHEGEFWTITGTPGSLIARGGDKPNPPDKETWEFIATDGTVSTHYYVTEVLNLEFAPECFSECPSRMPASHRKLPIFPATLPPQTHPRFWRLAARINLDARVAHQRTTAGEWR